MSRRIQTVSLVAPFSPFRGGIAQHSTMLANALMKITDLDIISYRRLYPKFLYPGGFQKDEATRLKLARDACIDLDAINPVSWFRVANRIRSNGSTVVVLPWWTFFLAPCYLVLLAIIKRGGVSVIFVCHNVSDHESAFWKRWFSHLVLARADGFLVHSDSIRRELSSALPSKPCLVAPMPVYSSYPAPTEALVRHAGLELLFFGFVREYKGLDILIRSLAALKRNDWHLTVAGECWNNPEKFIHLAEELGVAEKIEFAFRYVSEAEAANYIERADVLVLPYRSATGSAVIPTAYHYNKPVLVTPVGGLPEVVEHGVTGFILSDTTVEALSECLENLSAGECSSLAPNISHWKKVNNWDQLAGKLLEFVGSIRPRQSK